MYIDFEKHWNRGPHSEKEPKYFPEKHENINKEEITDFTELLPEKYGYSGSGEIINPPEIVLFSTLKDLPTPDGIKI